MIGLPLIVLYVIAKIIFKSQDSIIDRKCDKYFKSEEFLNLKENHMNFINEMNELNAHVNKLKEVSEYFPKTNYGVTDYSGANSNFNYSRPKLSNIEYSASIYDCSLSVLNNARMQPFKYICKYFNIKKDRKTLNDLQDILNDYLAIEDGKNILMKQKENLISDISDSVPSFVKEHRQNRLEYELGMPEIKIEAYLHKFTFRYISAGGNSEQSETMELTPNTLEDFIFYISQEIQRKGTASYQRSLMTKKLREHVKERDNFTCKICNNSIFNEPNLLLEIDHIIPLSKGGMSVEENLQTLCWRCNRQKGAKILNI
jgi:hypothetical protein